MKKLFLFTILFGNIFYWTATHPAVASGGVYSRVPTGTNPIAPVNMTMTWQPQEFELTTQSWELLARGVTGTDMITSGCLPVSQLSSTITSSIVGSQFWRVIAQQYDDANCQNNIYNTFLENEQGYNITIFTVTGPPITHYLTIAPASTSDLMASAGTVATDIWQIIALAMGIPTSFFAIKGIIRLVRR